MSPSSYSSEAENLRRNRILSSKLYFDVPPSKAPVIYSSSYNIAFMGLEKLHPFDSSKWGRICQFLFSAGVLDKLCIVEPEKASNEDLLVVHSEKYLSSLKSTTTVAAIVEVPPVAMLPSCIVQKKVLHPFRKQVGGSVLAAKLAKERGCAINVGGGFHHCSADRGGGFCAYADISLCIHFAFVRLNISRVMIIDLDAHQGNGHETDFGGDRRVYILDMYNPDIYPMVTDYIVVARRFIHHQRHDTIILDEYRILCCVIIKYGRRLAEVTTSKWHSASPPSPLFPWMWWLGPWEGGDVRSMSLNPQHHAFNEATYLPSCSYLLYIYFMGTTCYIGLNGIHNCFLMIHKILLED